jgi:cysteine-rich repeat protein
MNECDDGNNISGDGCSEACTIEKYYLCVNGSVTSASQCIYHRYDLVLSLTKADRLSGSNQGVFTFQLAPLLYSFSKLDLTNDVRFECNQSISVDTIYFAKGLLTVYVNFFEDLEGKEANVTMGLNNYFSQTTVSTAFFMVSSGIKLIIIQDLPRLLSFKNAVFGLSLAILVLFLASLFAHKMVGVELIHTYQIVYLVHLLNSNYTPFYSLLRWFTLTVFDFLYAINGSINVRSTAPHI